MRTLAHLLWSDLKKFPNGDGPVRPCELPAIGLPFRVAAFSLMQALHGPANDEANPRPGLWSFRKLPWKALVGGRLIQLGVDGAHEPVFVKQLKFMEEPLNKIWPIPIHPAYRIPFASSMSSAKSPPPMFLKQWESALLFLTAVDGRERLLDRFVESGPQAIRFAERWQLRSDIPLPMVLWDWIEVMFRTARTGSFRSNVWKFEVRKVRAFLEKHFKNNPLILPEEFLAERVDVSLEGVNSPEFPCAIDRRKTTACKDPFGDETILGLAENLAVRIAQITAELDWKELPSRFPRLRRSEMQRIMGQILRTFAAPGGDDGRGWEIAIFPEVSLPFRFHRSFQRIVAQTGRAGLIGCIWRELPTAVRPLTPIAHRVHYLVNEALLAVPLGGRTNPRRVRSFFVRKPSPTHVEQAFVECLSARPGESGNWKLIPGRRIYRFVHRRWGDFTVAICSDLIDPVPWASLRGQILHLFMCSYNSDVNLFEAMTWVRAYENCVNLVATNCGHYGGSFAWSPKSKDHKELARLRGNRVFVLADISLPVRELLRWQKVGVSASVAKELRKWNNKKVKLSQFKAPPPEFPGRRSV